MARRETLTKTVVDALRWSDADYIVWDREVPRFGVRVRQAGKHYVLRMRVDGRQRWYTIGKHGDPWTPDTAREEAGRVLGQAANVKKLRETGSAPAGLLHPVEARERARVVPTLAEFAKRYIAEHAEPHKGAGTLAADRGLLGIRKDGADPDPEVRTIVRALGQKRMDRITRSDLVTLHLAWKDTPTRANRALSLLSHMFTMAEKWGIRPDGTNPVRHVERFKEGKRERFLDGAELARLGVALRKLEAENRLTPWGLAAVRLLVFTGARASEVLGLTWEGEGAVALKAGTVRLERKGRMSTIYLNPPAREVLSRLRRIKGNPYVIVGGRDREALTLSGLEQVWQEVRDKAGLVGVRLHDLRHGFASVAAAGGASLPIIGALLGHTQAQTTARYAHLLGDPLKAAAGSVGRTLAAAMKPKRKARGNVASLGRRR
jgi:integrase